MPWRGAGECPAGDRDRSGGRPRPSPESSAAGVVRFAQAMMPRARAAQFVAVGLLVPALLALSAALLWGPDQSGSRRAPAETASARSSSDTMRLSRGLRASAPRGGFALR